MTGDGDAGRTHLAADGGGVIFTPRTLAGLQSRSTLRSLLMLAGSTVEGPPRLYTPVYVDCACTAGGTGGTGGQEGEPGRH